MIDKIQDEIVNHNPDLEHLRIRREKIHVTLVATYSEDGLEQLFDKTINKVKEKNDLSFELDEFDNFNGSKTKGWSSSEPLYAIHVQLHGR